ncbi:unnamed protein product, partial [Phaeothamnion confervicola]
LLGFLYWDCLFSHATAEDHGPRAPPFCVSAPARNAAGKLLLALAERSRRVQAELVNRVWSGRLLAACSHQRPFWVVDTVCRSIPARARALPADRFQWHYSPRQVERSTCGYVGLRNLGATCYMNALLQQFYMIPAVRYGILSCDPFSDPDAPPQEENLLYQLQADADEFLSVFMDRLETLMKPLQQRRLLRHVFGGQLCNQLIGQEGAACSHVSERLEDFFVLSLEVKDKRSILESLRLYVEGELLDGDNRFACSRCDAKRATLKRACIARLPNTLILHLKRFEFDLELMRKVKVNDFCEFPSSLDMRPFTKEGLTRDEQANAARDAAATAAAAAGDPAARMRGRSDDGGSDAGSNASTPRSLSAEDDEDAANATAAAAAAAAAPAGLAAAAAAAAAAVEEWPDEYYQYTLAGVLVHTGTADSGHYFSYIKERAEPAGRTGGQWFFFNDATVSPFNPDSIPQLCFGGEDRNGGMMRKMFDDSPKSFSAYTLIYERSFVLPAPVTPGTDEAGNANGDAAAAVVVVAAAAAAAAAAASAAEPGTVEGAAAAAVADVTMVDAGAADAAVADVATANATA